MVNVDQVGSPTSTVDLVAAIIDGSRPIIMASMVPAKDSAQLYDFLPWRSQIIRIDIPVVNLLRHPTGTARHSVLVRPDLKETISDLSFLAEYLENLNKYKMTEAQGWLETNWSQS